MTQVTAALIVRSHCDRHSARLVYAKGKCKVCYYQAQRDANVASGLCRCGGLPIDGRRQCEPCRAKGMEKNRRERVLHPARSLASARRGSLRWGEAHPERRLLVHARKRANDRGHEFAITEQDIVIPDVCPVLGIPLRRSTGPKACPNSPSLDRIDNGRGYLPGNVWVISARANRLKGDATLEELELVVAALKKKVGK